jgi:hypothetical protein
MSPPYPHSQLMILLISFLFSFYFIIFTFTYMCILCLYHPPTHPDVAYCIRKGLRGEPLPCSHHHTHLFTRTCAHRLSLLFHNCPCSVWDHASTGAPWPILTLSQANIFLLQLFSLPFSHFHFPLCTYVFSATYKQAMMSPTLKNKPNPPLVV